MRRVLIVSPHFPPVNAADMQRVRMLLPFLADHGWQAEVLAVEPEQVAAPHDNWLVGGLPASVPVHRAKALGLGWSRLPGLGTLGFRALRALARVGDRLLEQGGFELVYFSTTVFELHVLGPRWRRRFGVPFVMDYQDPWVNDYYRAHPDIKPPGGRLKYRVIDAIHRRMEPRVLQACSGITSVSPAYPESLRRRYPRLGDLPGLVLPFPGAARDLRRVEEDGVTQAVFGPTDGCRHWVYVGVVNPEMYPVMRALFRAIAASDEIGRDSLRLHFIGTSYAPAGQGQLQVKPLAESFGLGELVDERSDRIPYAQAMKCLLDADAILGMGSLDASYTASKIYPCLLARRPFLAVYHEGSSATRILREVGGATCVSFTTPLDETALARNISAQWLAGDAVKAACETVIPMNDASFEPYTDSGSAARLCNFWASCL